MHPGRTVEKLDPVIIPVTFSKILLRSELPDLIRDAKYT
jgi:hypothetical protein